MPHEPDLWATYEIYHILLKKERKKEIYYIFHINIKQKECSKKEKKAKRKTLIYTN